MKWGKLENCPCGLTSQNFKLFLGNHGPCDGEGRDHPAWYRQTVESQHLWWNAGALERMASWGDQRNCEGTINAHCFVQVWATYCMLSDNIFFREGVAYFSNFKPHSVCIIAAWLCNKRFLVLNWSTCNSNLWLTKNVWCIIKCKISQKETDTAEQLKSYIKDRMGKHSTFKITAAGLLRSQTECR